MQLSLKLAKNTFVLTVGELISKIFEFIFFIVVAKYLGPGDFGILSFALAVTAILGFLSSFGINNLIVREVARDRSLAEKFQSNIFSLKILMSIFLFGIFSILVTIFTSSYKKMILIYLMGIYTLLSSVNELFYGMYLAFEKAEYRSLAFILRNLFLLLSILLVLTYTLDVIWIGISYVIVSIIILGYNFLIFTWNFFIPRIQIDRAFIIDIIKKNALFGVTIFFISYFPILSVIFLGILSEDYVVGWYNGAFRIINTLNTLPALFAAAFYPIMSRLHNDLDTSFRAIYEKFIKYMATISFPIAFGITFLADKLVLLFLGADYSNSIVVFQILAWVLVIVFIRFSVQYSLMATNNELILAKLAGLCFIEGILLNVVLIIFFNHIGAALATFLVEFSFLLLCIKANRKQNKLYFSRKMRLDFERIGISSIIMVGIIILVNNLWMTSYLIYLIITILIAIFVYFLVLYCLKHFAEEIILLKTILKKLIMKGHI